MYINYDLFTVIMAVNLEFIRETMTFATYDMYKDFKTIHSLKTNFKLTNAQGLLIN